MYPGLVDTEVFRNARGLPWVARMILPLVRLAAARAAHAAETPVFLAQDPRAKGMGGHFYGPRVRQRPIPARALRSDRRAGLWTASEDLVRPYLPPRADTEAVAGK